MIHQKKEIKSQIHHLHHQVLKIQEVPPPHPLIQNLDHAQIQEVDAGSEE